MDVRPGGVWKHTMHGPDGADYPHHSTFRDVVPFERLVFKHGGSREGTLDFAPTLATACAALPSKGPSRLGAVRRR